MKLGVTTALALGALSVACQRGADVSGSGASRAYVLTLHPYFRDLRTVHAVRGTDTLTLLVDTGAGATLISPELAASIGCRPYGRQVGHRMSGEAVEFQACDSIGFVIDGWAVRHAPVAVFDVNALLPGELPRLDGVLSLESFRSQVITVDWPRSRIEVHGAAGADSALAKHGVPLRVATGDNGGTVTALTPVEGRRGPLWFLFDSGNIRGTLVDPHVLRDSQLTMGADSMADLVIGGRGSVRMSMTVTPINVDGALGTAYMQRGMVTLDLRVVP